MSDGSDDCAGVMDHCLIGDGGEVEEFENGVAIDLHCLEEGKGD